MKPKTVAKKLLQCCVFATLLTSCEQAFAERAAISPSQTAVLADIMSTAKDFCHIENCGTVLATIALTESSLGDFRVGDHGTSHGLFHIKTRTLKEAARRVGNKAIQRMSDKQLQKRLTHDQKFDIYAGILVLEDLHHRFWTKGWSPWKWVYRWNGHTNAEYVRSVYKNRKIVLQTLEGEDE